MLFYFFIVYLHSLKSACGWYQLFAIIAEFSNINDKLLYDALSFGISLPWKFVFNLSLCIYFTFMILFLSLGIYHYNHKPKSILFLHSLSFNKNCTICCCIEKTLLNKLSHIAACYFFFVGIYLLLTDLECKNITKIISFAVSLKKI